ASKASTRATAAPISASLRPPTSERVIPVTSWPRRSSSAMSGWPIAPLAPATKTLIESNVDGLRRLARIFCGLPEAGHEAALHRGAVGDIAGIGPQEALLGDGAQEIDPHPSREEEELRDRPEDGDGLAPPRHHLRRVGRVSHEAIRPPRDDAPVREIAEAQ